MPRVAEDHGEALLHARRCSATAIATATACAIAGCFSWHVRRSAACVAWRRYAWLYRSISFKKVNCYKNLIRFAPSYTRTNSLKKKQVPPVIAFAQRQPTLAPCTAPSPRRHPRWWVGYSTLLRA